jgi:hypothetical protein
VEGAAVVAVTLFGVIAVFQVALALGAPLGRAAWGGRHDGVLPRRLRIASAVAGVVVYPLLAAVVLDASALVDGALLGNGQAVMWLLAGLFGLGTVANLASRSTLERYWALVSATIAICCALIASGI